MTFPMMEFLATRYRPESHLRVLKSGPDLPAYPNPECVVCAGKCCKHHSGITSPEDWGAPDRKLMVRLLAVALRADYAIDWWEGKLDECYSPNFVRPRHVGSEHKMRDPSWGGQCIFLTDRGCRFPLEARPYNCRELQPNPKDSKSCPGPDKETLARMWIPYQDEIRKAQKLARRLLQGRP